MPASKNGGGTSLMRAPHDQTKFSTVVTSARMLPRRRRRARMRRFGMRRSIRGRAETAESFVVDQPGLRGMFAADGAFRVFADFQDAHVVLVRQRVEVNHLADQRNSRADYQLDRLARLDQ